MNNYIWIKQILDYELSKANEQKYKSPMRLYFEKLDKLVCSNFVVDLLNPVGEHIYYIDKNKSVNAFNVSESTTLHFKPNCGHEAFLKNEIILDNNDGYFPLSYNKMFTFGYCYISDITEFFNNKKNQSLWDRLDEVLAKILNEVSNFSYSEAMGKILDSNNPTLYECKNLCKTFGNSNTKVNAVNNVSFKICENELTVITGSSGSGKTTLLNILAAIDDPTSGELICSGEHIEKLSKTQLKNFRKDKIGYVYQNYNLIEGLTVLENIKVASCLVENPKDEIEVLRLVGLEEKRDNFPNQLSGGQQQRACIARALAKNSGILLCDEPTGALDTENSLIVLEIINNLLKNEDTTVIMITHNPDITYLADHCITLSSGKILDEYYQPFPAKPNDINLQ